MEVEEESLRSLNLLIKNVEKNVEHFITHDENQSSKILSGLREIYYLTKKEEAVCGRSIKGCPFERLQLDDTNFDVEIIWQQIQLQNECLLPKLSVEVKTLVNKPGTVFLRKEKPKMLATDLRTNKMESDSQILAQSDSEKGDCIIDNDSLCVEEVRHEGLEIPNITDKVQARMNEGSVVDDTFFKLDEMERFLESKYAGDGEMSDEDDDEENVDYFMDVNESKGLSKDKSNAIENIMYSDLFDYPEDLNTKLGDDKKDDNEKHILEKVAKHNDNERDTNKLNEDNFNDGRSKSTLEKQQEKVKKQIAALEQSNIATKSWQLSGETSASVRPQNSLLEEVLQFDHTMAPAPVITEERSKNLEDIITQRIKDNAWDDVERKEKPVKKVEYKKAHPISQEKSKMSLSEIYEREYQQQQNPGGEKENKEHVEIKKLMKSLFSKLDALTNFHFTPKPLKSEVTIVSNVPSINMEEYTPVNVNEAALLAPEEIYDKQKTEIKAQTEMKKQDRTRKRRLKKAKQRTAAKHKEKIQKVIEKTNPGLGNKYSKKKALETLKKDKSSIIVNGKSRDSSLTSSSGFFAKLQDNVREEIVRKSEGGRQVKKAKVSSASCKF